MIADTLRKPKVYFKTFGCRTNLFDTQVMMNALRDFIQTPYEEDSDIIIVNSCTVTNGADSGVRNYINRLQNEGKKIYFTGCGVKTQGESLLQKGLVFGVFGHSFKEQINELLKQSKSFYLQDDLENLDSTIITDFIGKSRAFIKIQEGCNFACSYCIIPSVRGKARSFSKEKILQQITTLCQKGFSEFILTGTNMGSWGIESKQSISTLLQDICQIDGVKRLRLGSLEPSQINGAFFEILANPKIERHLHIALQHTSPFMLKLMNRQNTYSKDYLLFEKLSKMGFALGSDYIIGHPQESQKIWEEALENFRALPLTHLHSFIYSPRDGTPSSTLKRDVRGNIAKERQKQLEVIVANNNLAMRQKLQQSNTPLNILIESQKVVENQTLYSGLDEYYNRIEITSKMPISKDCWIKVIHFTAKEDKNYAQI